MLAKSVGGFGTTSDVGHACFVRNEFVLMNKFIDSGMASSVTGTGDGSGTIEYVLNGQVDLIVFHGSGGGGTILLVAGVSMMAVHRVFVTSNFDAIG